MKRDFFATNLVGEKCGIYVKNVKFENKFLENGETGGYTENKNTLNRVQKVGAK